MGKKILGSIMLFGFLMTISACSEKENSEKKNTIGEITNKSEAEENVEAGKSGDAYNELPQFTDFSGEIDFKYVSETDCQSNVGEYPNTAYTNDGIYSLEPIEGSGDRLLYFYDYASEQKVVVCSKRYCEHNGESCDAYFRQTEYPIAYLWYNSQMLYTLTQEKDYLYIEKISLDGSIRENSCVLTRVDTQTEIQEDGSETVSTYYPEMQLHRGYIYYSTWFFGAKNAGIYRKAIDSDGEAETLYTFDGENIGLYRIKPYGRYVLFQIGLYNVENLSSSIYAYDTEKGTISKMCENVFRDYTVEENQLFYFDLKDNVYCRNLETGKTELFFEIKENTEGLDNSLFGTEEGLVYQLTDWNSDGKIQQILLDYAGEKEPEYIERQEEILSPY